MKTAGQSLRDPRRRIRRKPRSKQVGLGVGVSRAGGAEASSTCPLLPRLNLRQSVRVGAWNVLSLQEDARLPAMSMELARLGIAVAALSEVRRPAAGEISVGGYTYYWSGRADGRHTEGVALAVADRLVPLISEVTPVNERIMRLRLTHSIGVVSFVAVYAPTGMSEFSAKEAFYTKLDSVVGTVPGSDTLIVLGDFNATTGSVRNGYEACVGPHGSGRRDESSSMLLDFAQGRSLKIAGSWFQRPDAWRWTWYSNEGVTRKEIDHILVDGRWRLLENCRVFRSAQFFSADHRLLVATLKIRLRCPRKAASGQVRLDVSQLGNPDVAQEYATKLAIALGEPDDTKDPESLWTDFKSSALNVASECIPRLPRRKQDGISQETIHIIEKSRSARLDGKTGLSRDLRREAVGAMRKDAEARVRELCETVEEHLGTSASRPAYKAIRKLKPTASAPRSPAVRAADGTILTEESDVKDRWSGYFDLHAKGPGFDPGGGHAFPFHNWLMWTSYRLC